MKQFILTTFFILSFLLIGCSSSDDDKKTPVNPKDIVKTSWVSLKPKGNADYALTFDDESNAWYGTFYNGKWTSHFFTYSISGLEITTYRKDIDVTYTSELYMEDGYLYYLDIKFKKSTYQENK